VSFNRTVETEFAMVQSTSKSPVLPTDFDHHVVLFPTRPAAHVPTEHAPSAGVAASSPRVGVRTRVVREVVVRAVAAQLASPAASPTICGCGSSAQRHASSTAAT
jgi:hypothetical protein